jgi:hypothetical protein
LVTVLASACKKEEQFVVPAPGPETLEYEISSDGSYYSVVGIGTCKSANIVIPATYRGIPVKAIAKEAFLNCGSITSITIPESVTKIGTDAFKGTKLIQNEKNVAYVANWAVDCNPEATKVTVKDGTVGIAQGAFADCAALTSVSLPDSLKNINEEAFTGCTELLKKDNGVIYIDKWVISATATKVDANDSTNKDTQVALRSNTVGFAALAFKEADPTTPIVIPAGVKSINDWAFQGASSVTGVVLHEDVKSIGFGAFQNCTKLVAIYLGSGLKSIDTNAFAGCSNLVAIIEDVNAWLAISFAGTNSYPNHFGALYIMDSNGNPVTEVTLPSGTKNIGASAFENAVLLTKINLPASVTSIGAASFSGCIALTEIKIPNGVTAIADQAFHGCASLTKVTIPESVRSILVKAFYGCESLTNITFEGTKAEWNAIKKADLWNANTGAYVAHCTDGDIAK